MFLARILLCVAFLASPAVHAAVEGYYRFPTVHGKTIVFAAEGDLWQVSIGGGLATRLTTHDGNEAFPKFSPDGRWLAFSAEYEGNTDVYVVPRNGGEPKRLTYHPGSDQVVAWRPGRDSIVFRSQRISPHGDFRLFEVPLQGGQPEPLDIGIAALASFAPDGQSLAFNRLSREFRTWKRYLGGWAQDIWVGDLKQGTFEKITDWEGTDRFPMWSGERIYFVSDRTGIMNVYSCKQDGQDVRQHTRHTEYDARWPDHHDGRIVYMNAGDLWLYDTQSKKNHKIDIVLPTDRIRSRTRVVDVGQTVESYALDKEGKKIALCSRGEIWVLPTKQGRKVQLTQTSGIRERAPSFSPDGKSLAIITDQTGEQEIAQLSPSAPNDAKVLSERRKGWLFPPVWSPDGKVLAWADLTMNLFVMDASTRAIHTVDHDPRGEITEYAFSPDSNWLAYSKSEESGNRSIYLYDLKKQTAHAVTTPFTSDFSPAWDPEGKYLYFLSQRSFNPVLCDVEFQHTVTETTKPCALILANDGLSPFVSDEIRELATPKKKEAKKEPKKENDKKKETAKDSNSKEADPPIRIDLEGLVQRVVEFPVPSANLSGLRATKGKVFYTKRPTSGLLDMQLFTQDPTPRNALMVFDLKKKKQETFIAAVRDYTFSADGNRIAYRVGQDILVASTASKPGPDSEEKVQPSSIRLEITPRLEWTQIFTEAWRLQRDFYWAENLANVDWDSMRGLYERLLPRISTRSELNDLIGELIAELGTSHAYVFGGDTESASRHGVGLLGADVVFDEERARHRFSRILRSEPWETNIVSPLTMSHARVETGDYLFAINGLDLEGSDNVHQRLGGLGGEEILLRVGKNADGSDARDIQIEALRSEQSLRYRDWCRRNREFVDEASGGRIGYFHMPDMMGAGLVEFTKAFYPQAHKEALLIDVRYNGGGFVSTMLIEKLRRDPWAYNKPRRGQVGKRPPMTHVGHKAVLVNHGSGSDGDIFPESFQLNDLGPVIGTRTWGGVVGIRIDKRFIDGGLSSQPEFAWFDPERGWDLENGGVVPDIEVLYAPRDYREGRDPQLERGLYELERMLQKEPVMKPVVPDLPSKPRYFTGQSSGQSGR